MHSYIDKCQTFCIFLISIFAVVECILNSDQWYEDHNHSRDEFKDLFQKNALWNHGDIPLLNRKIFRGKRVTIREHPYIASVRRSMMHYLVATMLTKNLFVTVAHPLNDVPIDELSVVVGENYAGRGATLLTVILVIIHEDFDPYTLIADLALLRVYEDTPFRCSVKYIQLMYHRTPLSGRRAFVTGWGRCDRTGKELCLPRSSKYTPGEKFDPMLKTVSFIIPMQNLSCEGYQKNGVTLKAGMVCVGTSREEDKGIPCMAVPGASLVVNGQLAGIQSWGFGCGYENDLPLIYTSIPYYHPWLNHNIHLIRQLHTNNFTLLFEAKRAYLLTKWLNLTRVVSPKPLIPIEKSMDMLKVDKELAKLKGNVYDIRDYLYNGFHHHYKQRMYQKLRQKESIKNALEILQTTIAKSLKPFLTTTKKSTTEETVFKDTTDFEDTDSDRVYEEYIKNN